MSKLFYNGQALAHPKGVLPQNGLTEYNEKNKMNEGKLLDQCDVIASPAEFVFETFGGLFGLKH